MPDSNDITYEAYQIDFIYIGRQIFDILGFDNLTYNDFISFLETSWDVFVVVSLIVSFILVIGIVYAYIRYNQISELVSIEVETQKKLFTELYGKDTKNSRWEDVQNHIATDNPNDWKLAIIEADIMLDAALTTAGYAGTTIGDKLKSVSPHALQSLDDAWKAHKVRNQIAHAGPDFVLTHKVAQETITQYRRIFQELGVI